MFTLPIQRLQILTCQHALFTSYSRWRNIWREFVTGCYTTPKILNFLCRWLALSKMSTLALAKHSRTKVPSKKAHASQCKSSRSIHLENSSHPLIYHKTWKAKGMFIRTVRVWQAQTFNMMAKKHCKFGNTWKKGIASNLEVPWTSPSKKATQRQFIYVVYKYLLYM